MERSKIVKKKKKKEKSTKVNYSVVLLNAQIDRIILKAHIYNRIKDILSSVRLGARGSQSPRELQCKVKSG